MDISIIIISWNVKHLLTKCLDSIYRTTGKLKIEIIVVDNHSNDNTDVMIKKNFPNVILIANNENKGFAAANNQGIKEAKGKYLLFLNPDTEVLQNSFNNSLKIFEHDKNVGAVGAQILNPDKTIQPSIRRFPTFWSQIFILYKLHRLFPNLKTFKNYFAKDFDSSKYQEVDQIMGAYIFTDKEVIEKIGKFDEKFYLWFEEVDFCKRIKDDGFKVFYSPNVVIIHHGAQSFNQVLSLKKQKIFNKSMRYYFKKHHNKLSWFIISSAHFDSIFLAWISQLFKKNDVNR